MVLCSCDITDTTTHCGLQSVAARHSGSLTGRHSAAIQSLFLYDGILSLVLANHCMPERARCPLLLMPD